MKKDPMMHWEAFRLKHSRKELKTILSNCRPDGEAYTNAKNLLAEILDDGEIVRKKFIPYTFDGLATVDSWNTLKNELKCENRFFPASEIDEERLEELLSHLIISDTEISNEWYCNGLINSDTFLAYIILETEVKNVKKTKIIIHN